MTSDELKAFCKQRNLTYKELAEKIGMSEGGLKNALKQEYVSTQTAKAIELLRRVEQLEAELAEYSTLKEILRKALA